MPAVPPPLPRSTGRTGLGMRATGVPGAFPVGVLVGVMLISFNLRIPIVGFTPLLEELRRDTGMSSAAAGMLSTVPFLCMALFAFAGASILARVGARALIAGSIAALAIAGVARAAMPTAPLIILATLPIGIAVALATMAIPTVVKAEFPGRAGGVTGGYTATQRLGVAAASLLIVPLAGLLGGWRGALAASALPAALAFPVWLRVSRGRQGRRVGGRGLRRPSRVTLLLATVFGFQSIMFASLTAWLAPAYQDVGWSVSASGVAAAMLMLVGIPASLVIPGFTDGRDRRRWVAVAAFLDAAGLLGLAFIPTVLPWLWVSLFAIGNGALFPLSLTLPLDVSDDASEVGNVVAWTLGLGYLFSATGPVLVGSLRDASGSFTLPFALLAGFALMIVVLALVALPRPRAATLRVAAD